jgi:hypothetical protein
MTRASLLLLSLAACATGVGNGPATTDAPPSGDPDAASGHADAAPRPDAAPGTPDASTITTPDAPSGGGCAFSGTLATWDFTGQPGSQASTPATSSATGVTAGAIIRQTTLTASAGTGSINSSNWPTAAALDATKYYTITLTAPSGCTLDVASLSVTAKSSTTGPSMASVATSADGFAHGTSITTAGTASTPSVSATGASVEIRIYGFAASGTGGTMRVQNTLTVTGSIQ